MPGLKTSVRALTLPKDNEKLQKNYASPAHRTPLIKKSVLCEIKWVGEIQFSAQENKSYR